MRFIASRTLLLFVAAGVFVAGCEHADPLGEGGGEPEPTLSAIQETIFTTSCAVSGCHLGSNAPFGLDLSEGNAHANLVGVASSEVPSLLRVDPGNPEESYLLKKLRGDADIQGQRMPLGRDALSDEAIDLVREWIADGAPDN